MPLKPVGIEPCVSIAQPGWLALREVLWPDCPAEKHRNEMRTFLAHPDRYAQFIAYDDMRRPIGFVEASVRTDHVNGAETSPVGFLEGLFVVPEYRRHGIARRLVATAAAWASSRGCTELASDASIENERSHAVHRALGFAETERVVYFRRALPLPDDFRKAR